jgi:glycosyltransferase involved in cell wall biosynthesis
MKEKYRSNTNASREIGDRTEDIQMRGGCFFSIIIPTYNRPERIVSCLQAISQARYPRERFEVIIVDDGGTAPLEEIINPFRDRLALRLLRQNHEGVAAGRNTGARNAKGEILVFTDDDCRPENDWLNHLEMRFGESRDFIIGGRTINALPDNLFSSASQSLVSYLISYYNADPRDARFLTGSNLAVPARLFYSLGGFDRAFLLMGAEEREFCDRWRHRGYGMEYAAEAVVHHFHHLTLRSFMRQHFQYGRGGFHFQRLHFQRCRKPFAVEPPGFYLGMIRYPFRVEHFLRASLLALLLCVSQAANAAGYFREKSIASRQEPLAIQKKS